MDRHKWVIDIEEGMKDMDPSKEPDRWKRMSIFKVPPYIRSLNIDAYKPRVVSFGPYHHGKEQLKPMEAHKSRALLHFLRRSNCSFKGCCDKLKEVMLQLMLHYGHLDEEWRDKDRFLELMVVDGCFLLEFLLNNVEHFDDYDYSDPIFGHLPFDSIMYQKIMQDMLLIENQLPLLVLQTLLEVGKVQRDIRECIRNLPIPFSRAGPVFHSRFSRAGPVFHLLDGLRDEITGRSLSIKEITGRSGLSDLVTAAVIDPFPSASVLSDLKVKFEKSDTPCLLDIYFNGIVLLLPCIAFDEGTRPIFLNLLALEQLRVGKDRPVSSYVAFMGTLVRSANDVALLRDKGIIIARRQSDRAIAKCFSGLLNNPMVNPDDSLALVRERLNRMGHTMKTNIIHKTRKTCADWRSDFLKTYCRNIWTFMGLVGGILLLGLTTIQTVYGVLQFYN
ncbi:UPF0481-like protein [Cinnamomum micranthum f. kanehirae]|uniref:UPF0481-like protein n=1 Tax=Cinnamomum micranthum f. kanehirae TaxID=337451 RepID=A0A443PSW6_9MAGN|nr:UPF0481-like protein [Cinnamomum micranthum f. kanehirae]